MTKAFTAVIVSADRGGAFVEVPFDIKEVYGKGRVKVKVLFDNHLYRGSIVNMRGKYIIGIRKDIRDAIGKNIGDEVHVSVDEDLEERTVTIPADLLELLLEVPEAKQRFEKLSFTHQKEYVNWIGEAKKEETRKRRIEKTIEMLQSS